MEDPAFDSVSGRGDAVLTWRPFPAKRAARVTRFRAPKCLELWVAAPGSQGKAIAGKGWRRSVAKQVTVTCDQGP